MTHTFSVCTLLALVVSSAYAARILSILPFASRSHNAIFQKLMDGLHARGHELTVISYFPPKSKVANYTHISTVGKVYGMVNAYGANKTIIGPNNMYLFPYFQAMYHYLEYPACEVILSTPEVQKLYKSETKPFDLLIVEMYQYHCYLPLAAKHKVPVVWLLAPTRSFETDLVAGNVNNPASLPIVNRRSKFTLSTRANFLDRLTNTMSYLTFYMFHYIMARPRTERLCRRHFDDTECNSDELFKHVSMVLTYGHSSLIPRPLVPSMVEVGGLHVDTEKELPQDLQQFLDESTEGVLYVSFGSSISIRMSDADIQNVLLETFSRCPLKVVWKCDFDKNDSRIPSNVLLRDWVPQRDLLAHKNVKVFVTQGGILSIYEAIYTATVVVGIPFYFDQHDNLYRLAELEAGITVEYSELRTDLLTEAINRALNDKKYRENMQQLSREFQERPMSPLDVAVYWTEYVLRHKGAPHLRSATADMPLYEYLLADVVTTFVILFAVFVYSTRWLILRVLNRTKKNKRKIK